MDSEFVKIIYGIVFTINIFIGLITSIIIMILLDKKFYRPHVGFWTNPRENATGYDPFGVMMRLNLYVLVYYVPRVRKNYYELYISMKNNINSFERNLLRVQFLCMIVFWVAMLPPLFAKYIYLPETIKAFIPYPK